MKKFIALICCLFLALTPIFLVGCSNKNNSSDNSNEKTTNVYVELKSGGTGVQWLRDAGARFSDLKAGESYEDGKMGVSIIPKPTDNPSIKNAESSGSAIIDVMGEVNIESAVNCAIVDDNQKVILEKDIPIDSELDVQKIACVCNELLKSTNMSANDLAGIKTNEKEIGEQTNLIISEIRKKLF